MESLKAAEGQIMDDGEAKVDPGVIADEDANRTAAVDVLVIVASAILLDVEGCFDSLSDNCIDVVNLED